MGLGLSCFLKGKEWLQRHTLGMLYKWPGLLATWRSSSILPEATLDSELGLHGIAEKTLPGRLCHLARGGLRQEADRAPHPWWGGSLVLLGHFPSVDTVPLDVLSQQFRLLMASTSACYKLFREKQREGHGEAIMFKGECPRALGGEWGAEPPQRDAQEEGAEHFAPEHPAPVSGGPDGSGL